MTAIDQAFIRAYVLQAAAPTTAAPGSTGVTPPAHPLSGQAKGCTEIAPADPLSGPAKACTEIAPADPPTGELNEAGEDAAADGPLAGDVETSGGAAPPEAELPAETPIGPPADEAPLPDIAADPEGDPLAEAGPVFSEEGPPASGREVFLPSFQVDSFAWPSGATRLSMVAGDQVDQLADALTLGLDRGQEVVAITGCRRGDGCTTLLLCVARRLAERGRKIAMVDADFDNPLLARRLGLLPETGWEEVLAHRLPAGEVTIESIQDRLAVLPLSGSLSREDRPADDAADLAAGLNVLREHYDLVLIDLGEFAGDEASGRGVFDAVVDWIDAVVLVHNVRSTPQAELNRTRWRIQAAGLVEAGITENFVEIRQSA